ncbi:hypothetical protein K493DRAFT_214369 [Basidiobolus meristosporus CBS 931.73]|uniref:Cytochrome c oxidase assembly protein COX16, mitochondrial n=1 Tax=Basidiobolus meristosporus CBS 931.73 TaxID=1314790 RepID=A0A1Y1YL85_9FUNG|nr:hypothetical protein K493DRAFT_214369 [Basidiobolus meristosporus CBS 931.73]|eukprot:ORX98344.1 hypothetical protein K493DRAFT_214369 [Basidiobolus meristosporus CBS 931.73]
MPFVNRRPSSYPLASIIRKHPVVAFGVPFLTIIVGSSFLLTQMTQTRYDFHDNKVNAVNIQYHHPHQMSTEEKLKLDKNRRKFSLQEEYWRLQQEADEEEDWDIVRVERPANAE